MVCVQTPSLTITPPCFCLNMLHLSLFCFLALFCSRLISNRLLCGTLGQRSLASCRCWAGRDLANSALLQFYFVEAALKAIGFDALMVATRPLRLSKKNATDGSLPMQVLCQIFIRG